MTLTRVTLLGGIAVLGFMIVLAALGSTATREVLIGLAALVVLVGGGNWLSARTRRPAPPAGPDELAVPDGSDGPAEPAVTAEPDDLVVPDGRLPRTADPRMRCPMEPWARLATAPTGRPGAAAAPPAPTPSRTGP